MTSRTQILLKRLLTILDQMDGTPVVETILHAELGLNMNPPVRLTEFEALLAHADSQGWLVNVPSPVTRNVKWTISDTGRGAIPQL